MHTFALDWTSTTLTWYVDGVATRTEATPSDMHQPMTIFANLALGGSWAGPVNLGPDGQDRLQIDYIKVWDSNPYTAAAPAPVSPPPPPSVFVGSDQSVLEGNSGTTSMVFTLTRSGDLTGSTSLNWSTDIGGGGTNAPNLTDVSGPISGSVTFAAGESQKQIIISVNGDVTVEPDEVFHLTVSNVSGGVIGDDGVAVGTILNDDTALQSSPVTGQVIVGTKYADYLEGGSGNDTLTGGRGIDTFGFHTGDGHDVITDFATGRRSGDHIDLGGAHYQLSQVSGGTLLTLDSGDTLLLENVTLKQLSGGGWLF
jgi:Ca2+-binding RTX toxin-like protein